ncbi:hypothetical protein M529_01295 [Sphingobium ummariense RL-3]|uniref:JmjC domain-containing protein n=2 Tax=Sphingobium TaxID=165695 RepID=T0JAW6_9SPHN|nr:cupin-like domain-containing protein [Sphingobium ummariense]EQB33987.1 hypothetical protein M529_01295 [Sphingobium ummariense RL-3]
MPEIDRVEAGALSDPAALRSLAGECRPTLIAGLCASWPAVCQASDSDAACAAYLAGLDGGEIAEAFIGARAIGGRYHYGEGLEGFNFARETMRVEQALARILANAADGATETLYMGSLPTDQYLARFPKENSLAAMAPHMRPRIWMGNASTIACHFDTYDNLACVIAGRRRFTLYPPDAIADLYVGPIDHTMAGQPVSLAAGAAPGDPRYPRFAAAAARAITVDLEPGDALYLPKLWWHQVEATAPFNVLANYWWDAFAAGPDVPFPTMLLSMIAIAERPEAERQAWRAYFDHYVFRPEGHPLAHLSPEKHGVLGPLGQGNYGRIRAWAMRLLRGA